jgi:predicted ribosome quality control (RQC) complex YloA/Tae2 family protein
MDNHCLNALYRETRPTLRLRSIQKIRFSSDLTLVLSLRPPSPKFFVISLAPTAPIFFLSNQDVPLQSMPSDFLMLLRKKIQGGRVVEFSKEPAERILILEVEKRSLSNQQERFRLVIRLIPHLLNVFLLNSSDEVIGSTLPVAHSGEVGKAGYWPIPPTGKYRVDSITQSQFFDLFTWTQATRGALDPAATARVSEEDEGHRSNIQPLDLAPLAQISGLTPTFTHELRFRHCCTIESLWAEFQLLSRRFADGPFSPRIYFRSDPLPDPAGPSEISPLSDHSPVASPIPLEHLASCRHQTFTAMNELAAELFQVSRTLAPIQRKTQALKSVLTAALKKKLRLKQGLREDLQKNVGRDIFQKYSNLLYAQPEKPQKGIDRMLVPDLFDASVGEIEIPLDPQLSLIQNANRFARLFQKANRAIPLIKRRLQAVDLEISEIKVRLDHLANPAETSEKVESVFPHPQDKNIPKKSAETPNAGSRSVRRQTSQAERTSTKKSAKIFVSTEGMEIWVGKSSRENDVLTFKLAKPDDFWLHVAGYGGSHVVLRNPERLSSAPQQSLIEAAEVAAYFSQARNANKVEVHHTQRKHVSKPKGSKPGLVQLREFKSVSVRPRCELEIKKTLQILVI